MTLNERLKNIDDLLHALLVNCGKPDYENCLHCYYRPVCREARILRDEIKKVLK